MATISTTVALDALTAEILAVSAEQNGLSAAELCSLILYQAAATRVGWPGADGRALRTAWRDVMHGAAHPEPAAAGAAAAARGDDRRGDAEAL